MKKLIFYFFVLFSTSFFAQVGINTTTPNAQLDIRSSNQVAPASTDGMLIPKVDTFPASNPTIAQQGMLVYLTTNVGSNQPGFYYWDNSILTWTPIGNNNNSGWKLTGNSGTNPTTNFIGSTDNTIVFKSQNIISGRLGSGNTSYGQSALLNHLTSNLFNSAFGNFALSSNASGQGNTAVGNISLRDNVSGNFNTAVGINTLVNNTSGSNNVAFGSNALISENNVNNTAIGSNSMTGNLGSGNTALGFNTLNALNVGNNNTAIGQNSDVSNVSNATAIGSNAFAGASNSLVLGSINGVNGATSSVNVGIGTTTPLDRLHIVGNIRMVDGNQASGRVLTSDANGTASWQNSTISAWGLNGNATTNPAINFIGTTDNQDVIFRRNNIQSGLIGVTNTSFGSTTLTSNTTGINNTAIGRVSLNSNTTGSFNTAVGGFALSNSTNGANNTAVGYQANLNNTSGQSNTSLGQLALLNTTSGAFNTAIGRQSLTNNITGSSNTVLGALSNVGADNLINATAIGARAQVDNSNSVVIGSVFGINGATGSVNVGIGTTSPARRLHVSNGSSGGISGFNTGILLESNTSVYQHFLSSNVSESGLLFGSNVASILGGIIFQNNTQSLNFRVGGGATRMVISNIGDVGIGTFFPGGQFELSLNEGRKPLSNFWTTTSDARLKNVNGVYEKGLSEIIQLKPIRYNYKNSDKRTFEQKVLNQEATGFLAQEVQQIFPEAVGVDRDGYLNFDLHPIMIASINAFKELNNKYEELKNKNEELEAKLNELLNRIEKIENK
jgi:hypothetical protein